MLSGDHASCQMRFAPAPHFDVGGRGGSLLQSGAMRPNVSIAIETSCRQGGLALGVGGELASAVDFDASARHAAQLISRLDAMLRGAGLTPPDLREVYVSAGPGSFTGLRIGITVARTLCQAFAPLRAVAVPTANAVAQNARELDFKHLGVVMDARHGLIYCQLFARRGGWIAPAGGPGVVPAADLASHVPPDALLIGEGLSYHDLGGQGFRTAQPPGGAVHMPRAENVWRVGRRLARLGRFTTGGELLPIYLRKPEAVRLWDARTGEKA